MRCGPAGGEAGIRQAFDIAARIAHNRRRRVRVTTTLKGTATETRDRACITRHQPAGRSSSLVPPPRIRPRRELDPPQHFLKLRSPQHYELLMRRRRRARVLQHVTHRNQPVRIRTDVAVAADGRRNRPDRHRAVALDAVRQVPTAGPSPNCCPPGNRRWNTAGRGSTRSAACTRASTASHPRRKPTSAAPPSSAQRHIRQPFRRIGPHAAA